jgi:hypothetical protein
MAALSLTIAVYSLAWLIAAGYCKGMWGGEWEMAAILVLAILPLPISTLVVWAKLRTYRRPLSSAGDRLQAAFSAALRKIRETRGEVA